MRYANAALQGAGIADFLSRLYYAQLNNQYRSVYTNSLPPNLKGALLAPIGGIPRKPEQPMPAKRAYGAIVLAGRHSRYAANAASRRPSVAPFHKALRRIKGFELSIAAGIDQRSP